MVAVIVWMLLSQISPLAEAAPPPPPPVLVEPLTPEMEWEPHYQMTLQTGTGLLVVLQTPIHTGENQLGDPVEAFSTQDIFIGHYLLLPKNTRLYGQVSTLEPPLQGRNAVLGVRFHQAVLPDGMRLNIVAHVRTERDDHNWGGELTPGTKPVRVTHRVMGIGAYNKISMMGPRRMGSHLAAKPGEVWTVVLEQPLQFPMGRDGVQPERLE